MTMRNVLILLTGPVCAVIIVLGGYRLLGQDFLWAVLAALWVLAAVALVYSKGGEALAMMLYRQARHIGVNGLGRPSTNDCVSLRHRRRARVDALGYDC